MKSWRSQILLLSILALSAMPGSALLAQNITGTWQGTLKLNGANGSTEIRTVWKISRAADESLKGVLYSIDQNPTPITVTSVAVKGSAVKLSIAQLNGTFEGTLSADGNSINGNLTQGGPAMALNLVRATNETAWAIPDPPAPPVPMAAGAKPEFAVATVKPSDPARAGGQGYGFRGHDVITVNTTTNWLITLAYNMHAHQLIGGARWMDSDKYDVTGRPDTPGQPSRDQLKLMIQKLLTDRFQLKYHIEKRELPAYTITVLKTGAKITESADPQGPLGVGFGIAPGGGMTLTVRNAILDSVANAMQGNLMDQPVINQTGLTGKYDFTLKFTPDASQMAALGPLPPGVASDPDGPPDIFTAFQQQLGLKLTPAKTAVDVMVIEKIEKPGEN
jgi:uncharacterized protein (TIGR03435 family)